MPTPAQHIADVILTRTGGRSRSWNQTLTLSEVEPLAREFLRLLRADRLGGIGPVFVSAEAGADFATDLGNLSLDEARRELTARAFYAGPTQRSDQFRYRARGAGMDITLDVENESHGEHTLLVVTRSVVRPYR